MSHAVDKGEGGSTCMSHAVDMGEGGPLSHWVAYAYIFLHRTGYRVPNKFILSNISTLPFWYQENIIFLEVRFINLSLVIRTNTI